MTHPAAPRQDRRPAQYRAMAAITLDRAAELRWYASRCPWDRESRRDVREAWMRVSIARHCLRLVGKRLPG